MTADHDGCHYDTAKQHAFSNATHRTKTYRTEMPQPDRVIDSIVADFDDNGACSRCGRRASQPRGAVKRALWPAQCQSDTTRRHQTATGHCDHSTARCATVERLRDATTGIAAQRTDMSLTLQLKIHNNTFVGERNSCAGEGDTVHGHVH